jgi:hypothetical protein
MNFEFKGVKISEPIMMDIEQMSGHPKLFHQDHPINAHYIYNCKVFGYEEPVINTKGEIFSHYNDWVARRANGGTQMAVRIVEGIEDYEIPFLFHKNALTKTDYPGLAFFITEWLTYLTKHPVGIEMCKTISGRDINYKIGDILQISGSMVEKIRVIMDGDSNLLHAIGKHDKEGRTFVDVLKEAGQKIKVRKEKKNGRNIFHPDHKSPTKGKVAKSSNPQPLRKRTLDKTQEGINPDDITFSIIVAGVNDEGKRECTLELNGENLSGLLSKPIHNDDLKAYSFRFITDDKRVIDISVPDYKPIQMHDTDNCARSADKSAKNLSNTYAAQI